MTGACLVEAALPLLPGDAGRFRFDNYSQKAYSRVAKCCHCEPFEQCPHRASCAAVPTVQREIDTVFDPLQPTSPAGEHRQHTIDLSAYRGCWVALVGEQVAGVGATAEAARLAAHRSRPRERISATLWVPDEQAPGP